MARLFMDPYAATASPISDSVSKLGMALLSQRKSPEELDYMRSRTEHSGLESEKLRRGFRGQDETAEVIGKSSYTPEDFAKLREVYIRGGGDPSKLGELVRVAGYTWGGAPQSVRDSSFLAAGGAASGTETGHKKTLDNAITQTGMTVAGANSRNERSIQANKELEILKDDRVLMPVIDETGATVMRPKSQVGQPGFLGTPVLPSNLFTPSADPSGGFTLQPNRSGMPVAGPHDKQQPFNVLKPDKSVVLSRDGVTDLQGNPIPPGSQKFGTNTQEPIGTAEAKGLRDAQQGQTELDANIQGLRKRLTDSPNSLGAVGTLRGTLQSALQQGDAFAQTLGFNVDKVRAAAATVDPALAANFDPNLPQIDLLANVIAYQAAGVFAGQQGRDVSNRDFAIFRNMIGDSSVLGNAKEMNSRLDVVEEMLGRRKANTDARIGNKGAPAGAPAAPTGPRRIRLNTDGSLIE